MLKHFFAIILSTLSFACPIKLDTIHEWKKVVDYEVRSSFVDVKASVCLGFYNGELDRVAFVDNLKNVNNLLLGDLFDKDTAFLKKEYFPSSARAITKNIAPLTIKVLEDNNQQTKISLKYIENMAITARYPKYRDLEVVYLKNVNDLTYRGLSFNKIALTIGFSLKINKLLFYKDNDFRFYHYSKNLPTTRRVN